ncbi:MAG: aryl-sulfate sulfotransferase [Chloroflexota bacterium]
MRVSYIAFFAVILGLFWPTTVDAQSRFGPYEYVSPRPDAMYVSAGTTIAVRHGDEIDASSLSADLFMVEGSMSGMHSGTVILADDGKTVIFTPDGRFTPEETVNVTINSGITLASGMVIEEEISHTFTVSALTESQARSLHRARLAERLAAYDATYDATYDVAQDIASANELMSTALHTDTHPYATIPPNFPFVSVTVEAGEETGEGHIFAVNLTRRSPFPHLLILDNSGEPVWFKAMEEGTRFRDLRKQRNGMLTYFYTPDFVFHEMDNTYRLVGEYKVGNGYLTDFHGLQVREDGYALLQVYDDQPIDMSQIVEGGLVTATVTGALVQEIDPSGNVIFEWRSWDHFEILDASDEVDFTSDDVDVTHINSADWDYDGNIIMSNRNIDEVTKVDRATGDVIWRWGGKKNQFTLTNAGEEGVAWFNWQHDARRQETGTITLFDNGNHKDPPHSRAVEFEMDEENMTVTQVWQYRNDPDFYGRATGNVQRLPNGNSVIDWGGVGIDFHLPFITEVTLDGRKAYEAYFQAVESTYRVFRFPWEGRPFEPPMLVASTLASSEGEETTLHYSWNGATHIASYDVYGGTTTNPADFTKVDSQTKESFETVSEIAGSNESCYFYCVVPIDQEGQMGTFSNLIFAGDESCALVATVSADSATEATLDAPETSGSVLVNAPAGVVDETVTLVLDDIPTPTQPLPANTNLVMAFTLDAQMNGALQPNFRFNAPVSLSINYSEEAIAGQDETTLNVRFWNADLQVWSTEGIEITGQDAENNQVTFTTDHLTLFALFAQGAAPTAIEETIDLLADGSFEMNKENTPWTYWSQSNGDNSYAYLSCSGHSCGYDNVLAQEGERLVFLGDFTSSEQARISQEFIAPSIASDAEATVALWIMRRTLYGDNGFTGNNTIQVMIDDNEVLSLTGLDLREGRYVELTADVAAFLNGCGTQTLSIRGDFEASSGAFYIDNVRFQVTTVDALGGTSPSEIPCKMFLPFIGFVKE